MGDVATELEITPDDLENGQSSNASLLDGRPSREQLMEKLKELDRIDAEQEEQPDRQQAVQQENEQSQDDPKNEETPSDEDEDKSAADAAAEIVAQHAGMSLDDLNAEFAEKQDLSEETRSRLLPRIKYLLGINGTDEMAQQLLEVHLEGLRSQTTLSKQREEQAAAQAITRFYEGFGGEDTYQKMATWMQSTLPVEDLQKFDADIAGAASVDHQIQIATQMKQKFEAATGRAPVRPLAGNRGGNVEDLGGFNSRDEFREAQRDPRYGRDRAYTAEVKSKLERSSFMQS